MHDLSEQLEQLLAYAADCELIATLVADPSERDALRRLAISSREMVIARASDAADARHSSVVRLARRLRGGGVA